MGLIANEAVKGDDGAVFRGSDVADESGHVDGLANQLENVVVEVRVHENALTTTDGWKEGNFVPGIE